MPDQPCPHCHGRFVIDCAECSGPPPSQTGRILIESVKLGRQSAIGGQRADDYEVPKKQAEAVLGNLVTTAGDKRVAEVMTAAPFAAVIVLTRRIRWFDMGEHTNAGQDHHAWVVFDHHILDRAT